MPLPVVLGVPGSEWSVAKRCGHHCDMLGGQQVHILSPECMHRLLHLAAGIQRNGCGCIRSAFGCSGLTFGVWGAALVDGSHCSSGLAGNIVVEILEQRSIGVMSVANGTTEMAVVVPTTEANASSGKKSEFMVSGTKLGTSGVASTGRPASISGAWYKAASCARLSHSPRA